jgi:hypothetical protein
MPDKKDLTKSIVELREKIDRMEKQTHAGFVMRLISIIEYDLERSIKYKFRPLSNKMSKRLFDDGPISSFAAKIDLGYALDITADATHQELDKIRQIRNAFAHTRDALSFETEPIKSLFEALARPSGITGTRLEQFVQCVAVLDDYFEAFLARMGESQDLRILNQKNVRD